MLGAFGQVNGGPRWLERASVLEVIAQEKNIGMRTGYGYGGSVSEVPKLRVSESV